MKNSILILALSLVPIFAFGQTSLKVTDVGDVGIGTSTPSAKLEVMGLVKSSGLTVQESNASGTSLYERTDRSAMLVGAGWNAGFSLDQDYHFDIYANSRANVLGRVLTGGTLMMRGIGSTGYFGFGIYNPTEKLHVSGNIFATGTITPSDSRLKDNVTEFEDGLNVIKNLNTIRYKYNGKAGLETKDFHIGVYAQDLQKEAPYLVEEFIHQEEDARGNVIVEEKYLKIRDSEIKYLLLNATKEQQTIIEQQQEMLRTQQAMIEQMQKEMEAIKAMMQDKTAKSEMQNVSLTGKGQLSQNTPNPFSESTLINYELNDKHAKANIHIFSLTGELLKVVPANGQTGQVTVEVNDMPAGTYTYSLIVDGQVVDSKKMVLTK